MDHLNKSDRSKNMSKIHSKDTQSELIFRKAIHKLGFRYILHDKRLAGKPDLFLPKYKLVVFIHGCFWHVHEGCRRANIPKSNIEYWTKKLSRNVSRDAEVKEVLEKKGLRVFIVWECELKNINAVILRFLSFLKE